jgi:3-hydroxypropanoate dehydrogenase
MLFIQATKGRIHHDRSFERARALGLDTGPISGFDNAGVDKAFFAGTSVRSNFLCNLGYGDWSGLLPRSPRFTFADVAKIV